MNGLLQDKYEYAETDIAELLYWSEPAKNKYGFVYVKNPNYLIDDDREYLIRKPTPTERKEIIVNTVIECNGRSFKIPVLAEKLGVTDRTIQTILRQLERDGIIQITPKFNKDGRQKGNVYKYVGPACIRYGSGLTLKALYNPKQDVGFRDWAWKEYGFAHNKVWHDVYTLCKAKFERRKARGEYLLQNNLPLVVPEDIKYLVLRYAYWKGKENRKSVKYSKDGTIKIALEPLNRIETIPFFGYNLCIELNGSKDNPEITITDVETKKILGVFTWFRENVIQSNKKLDNGLTEQYFILGDFTSR